MDAWDTDSAGRGLDRLAGLEQVITPELVRQSLEETKGRGQRICRLRAYPKTSSFRHLRVIGFGI